MHKILWKWLDELEAYFLRIQGRNAIRIRVELNVIIEGKPQSHQAIRFYSSQISRPHYLTKLVDSPSQDSHL